MNLASPRKLPIFSTSASTRPVRYRRRLLRDPVSARRGRGPGLNAGEQRRERLAVAAAAEATRLRSGSLPIIATQVSAGSSYQTGHDTPARVWVWGVRQATAGRLCAGHEVNCPSVSFASVTSIDTAAWPVVGRHLAGSSRCWRLPLQSAALALGSLDDERPRPSGAGRGLPSVFAPRREKRDPLSRRLSQGNGPATISVAGVVPSYPKIGMICCVKARDGRARGQNGHPQRQKRR